MCWMVESPGWDNFATIKSAPLWMSGEAGSILMLSVSWSSFTVTSRYSSSETGVAAGEDANVGSNRTVLGGAITSFTNSETRNKTYV